MLQAIADRPGASDGLRGGAQADVAPDVWDAVADAVRAAREVRLAEAEHAYKMAIVARVAAGRRCSGRSAVEVSARSLGVTRRTLQQFAILATRWTFDEYRVLLERRGPSGHSLTVSHLLVVAPLSREAREHWIARVLLEGLAVRTLRAQIARSRHASQAAVDF
jgi:hypothetical protein